MVVEVDVDEPDDVDEESADEEALVACGSDTEGLVTATVEPDDEPLPLPHAASASAATMNFVVDLVYFTVSLSSANALFERGSVATMCSRPRRRCGVTPDCGPAFAPLSRTKSPARQSPGTCPCRCWPTRTTWFPG